MSDIGDSASQERVVDQTMKYADAQGVYPSGRLAPVGPALGAGESADYYDQGYWRHEDIWSSIVEVAAERPHDIAFIDGDATLSFQRMTEEAQAIAAGMQRYGVASGDVVVVHARNSIESVQALLACACLGAVMTPVPPIFSAVQLAAICRSAQTKILIALGDAREVNQAVEGARAAGCVAVTVVPDSHALHPDTLAWSALRSESVCMRNAIAPDSLALLVYSSGTTGSPKGVMHSSNTVRYAIEQRARLHGVQAGDICLVASQFGFVGSAVFGLLAGPLLGVTSVLMHAWTGDEAVRLIARHRICYSLLMPTHVHDVLASPLLGFLDTSSFRRCAMGGLTRERRKEVRERLCPNPLPAYGMSECLGFTTGKASDGDAVLLETDGYPFPGTRARIVDQTEAEASRGAIGHILVRGPSRFLGYYGNTALTSEVIDADGYFRTGDMGCMDAEGNIRYVAREKDIIRRGGVTIIPGDLEAVLATHVRIEHVAVVGLPDERLGERACACVITRDGEPLSLEEIRTYLEEKGVARYTWPERVALFDSFPRSASLKVQKGVLAERLIGASA